LVLEVKQDALEVGFIEDLFVFGGAEEESGAADVVDEAGNTFGLVVQGGDEGIGEKLSGVTGDGQLMFEVSGGFGQVEGREGIADGDALVESLVGGEAEFGGQIGLADQDEGEEGVGIEIVVEQEAELVKKIGGQEMSLVDDEEGEAIFAGQGMESLLELGEQAVKGMGRFKLEGQEDVGIQGGDIEAGIGQINQGMEGVVKGLDKGTNGGGFAGADLTGDKGGQAFLQGVGQAALNFLVSAGGEELVRRDGSAKGGLAETVVVIEQGHEWLSGVSVGGWFK
jgi:hypothetical protein